jgi:two-component system, cell cycle response regulator DivK
VSHRVLVVEDNNMSRELLCDWLEMERYQAAPAANLEQAFAILRDQPPDLVLLDIQLGAEDGLLIASWIRRQPALSHLPVIAVSAHAMISEQERIFLAGCNAHVSKPVDFKLLGEQLERWLAIPRTPYLLP